MHVIGKLGRKLFKELDVSWAEKHDYETLKIL